MSSIRSERREFDPTTDALRRRLLPEAHRARKHSGVERERVKFTGESHEPDCDGFEQRSYDETAWNGTRQRRDGIRPEPRHRRYRELEASSEADRGPLRHSAWQNLMGHASATLRTVKTLDESVEFRNKHCFWFKRAGTGTFLLHDS